MGQVFKENIPALVKSSSTVITLAATNLGQPTHIQIGGQSYSLTAGLSMSTATVGFNGLDTGAMAINTLYHVYAVLQAGVVGLVISVTGPATGPTGFTSAYKFLGKFRTEVLTTSIAFVATDKKIIPVPADEEWSASAIAVPINLGAGSATNSAQIRRNGTNLEIVLRSLKDGTPGSGASAVTYTLPSGYTIALSLLNNGYCGVASLAGATFGPIMDVQAGSSTTFYVRKNGAATNINGADMTASSELNFRMYIPIAEFAGLYT